MILRHLLVGSAAVALLGCHTPPSVMNAHLGPVRFVPREAIARPAKIRTCIVTTSVKDSAKFVLEPTANWSSVYGFGETPVVEGLRGRIGAHASQRLGASVDSECTAKHDVAIYFESLVLVADYGDRGTTALRGRLAALVQDRRTGRSFRAVKREESNDVPSGTAVVVGFAAGELTVRLVDDILREAGFDLRDPEEFTGDVFWHAWPSGPRVPRPPRDTPAVLASPKEVASARCIAQMEIHAVRHAQKELPDLSRLLPRLGRAAATFGATHYVIVSSKASNTATPIPDFPRASTLFEARVDLYVLDRDAGAQGS